jgi:hypothetical protein
MIHTLPFGCDPFSPEFDEIKRFAGASPDEDPPAVWPACYPPQESDYDSRQQNLGEREREGNEVAFKTVSLPRNLEAHVTLGGFQFPGSVRLSTNFRSLRVPRGHFTEAQSYEFPYTFLLYEGENDVTLQFEGGAIPDLSNAWYRVHDALFSNLVWTYPIVGMEMNDPEWIDLFTSRIVDIVREYDIDAVHVDADHLWYLDPDDRSINGSLFEQLPDIVFSTEQPVEASMVMFQLAQNGVIPGVIPVKVEEEAQPEYSPLAQLIYRPYRQQYLHLCAAGGFVPVVSVCTIDREPRPGNFPIDWAPELAPGLEMDLFEEKDLFRRAFSESEKYGVLRNIRVNYRDYGLDEETKDKVVSLYSDN